MIRANRQFFVVKIDKNMQTQKRNNLVSKNIGYFGIKHSASDDDDKLNGVRVWDVEFESPAYHAAFKHNDIITQINGTKVNSYEQMAEQLSLYAPGQEILISYINSFSLSKCEELTKLVKLGERKFEIVLPPHIVDFQFNLQIGELVEIGSIAGKEFPEAEIGDTLIFHHAVEHKPRPEGDVNYNDFHLVDTDENGDEYRSVNYATELFGVLKLSTGSIIPYKKFIFCRADIKKASIQKTASGLWVPDGWEKSQDELQQRIDDANAEIAEIMSSNIMKEKMSDQNYKKQEIVKAMVNELNRERRELTKKMSQKKLVELTVLFINPVTCEELQTEIQAGDTLVAEYNTLYPLDMYGVQYTLLRKEYTEAVILKS